MNFAARLAGAGAVVHGGEIWLGENTYRLVKDTVQLRETREVAFKGIPEPRPVYIVTGLISASTR